MGTDGVIYLDNAATSWPKPPAVVAALDEFTRLHAANPGRSGHRMAVEAERRIEDARRLLAKLVNAPDPRQIVFTLNGSDALNIAIKGVLRAGDTVVTSTVEHNSVNRPLGRLAKLGRITLHKIDPQEDLTLSPDALAKKLARPARLVALTLCSNVLGAVSDAAELARAAHRAGALVLFDAAQAVGATPIDVQKMDVDLLAFPGHKALYGPMGTGALYVRPGIDLDFFREGGTGTASESDIHPSTMPHRLEAGTPNALGLAGLAAGLRFVDETDVGAIAAHERKLAARFCARVRENPKIAVHNFRRPDASLGLVTLSLKGAAPDEVGALLDQRYRIACRPGIHCAPGAHKFLGTAPQGAVRFSFGFFNTEADVDAAVGALNEISTAF